MGRPEFEQIVAMAPKKYLKQYSIYNEGVIGSGVNEFTSVFAPSGTIAKVAGVFFSGDIVSTATSGYHRWMVLYDIPNTIQPDGLNLDLIEINQVVTKDCKFMINKAYGDNSISPTQAEIPGVISNISFDDVTPLMFAYKHETGVNSQAGHKRRIVMNAVIEQVAKV